MIGNCIYFSLRLFCMKILFLYVSYAFTTEVASIRATLQLYFQFLATENPLKIMKNAFYFTLKAIFVFNFCLDFLVIYKNGLIKKISFILKVMMSQLGKKTISIHILPNISRTKGNQTIKFGQLRKCNTRNIFVEKSYAKCGGKIVPRS